jgi:HK97 family phage major capsid protein
LSDLLRRLREQRRQLLVQLRAVSEPAAEENRELRGEEQAAFQRLSDQLNGLDARIGDLVSQEDRAAGADEAFQRIHAQTPTGPGGMSQADREIDQRFRSHITTRNLAPIVVDNSESRSGFQPGIERRDLVTTSGGGMVPTSFFTRILRHMVDSSSILAAGATVLQTNSGEPLSVPKSTAFSTAAIVAEAGTIGESDPTLAKVTLGAFKYGFMVQVSYELAEDSTFDLLGFLAEQCGIAIGNAFGAHAVTGTGSGQPRGLDLDATVGVTGPAGTGTSFGTHTTAGQGGDLFADMVASLAEPYVRDRSMAFLMRSATLNTVRKLRDGQSRYVFDLDAPAGSGASGSIFGKPVYVDPNVEAMANGNHSVIYGAFSRYWVRQVNQLRFEASRDFAFSQDLVSYRCLARLDGALIDTSGAVKKFQHTT